MHTHDSLTERSVNAHDLARGPARARIGSDRIFLHTYVVEGLRASARPVYVGEGGRG